MNALEYPDNNPKGRHSLNEDEPNMSSRKLEHWVVTSPLLRGIDTEGNGFGTRGEVWGIIGRSLAARAAGRNPELGSNGAGCEM